MEITIAKKRPRKRTCRAAVQRALRERGVSAEQALIALVDVIVDGHIDFELRARGLGPEWYEGASELESDSALMTLADTVVRSEFTFGKGFGRRPARGTVDDMRRERQSMMDETFERKLTPLQRTLRHLTAIGWSAAERHLDRVDPPNEA